MAGPNGVKTRGKRKQRPASPLEETPAKKQRASNGTTTESEYNINIDERDMEELSIVPAVGGSADAEWQKTIESVVQNVVSIRFCQTCAFDTDPAVSSEATGFVVDAERGYILTNRHVVGAGPFWGRVVFDNHEEVDCYPIYRDPIHDFGILRFDPKAIKYMKVAALTLRPDLAKVGVQIKVVGNDAGEKLSILSGVISRIDRNAPEYGDGYCDFNTNYIQAAAAASGGSSGSPVVNIDGYAIALQAGGRSDGAATDYFLPLDRPLRALQCIQNGEPITRGDIQCQWMLKPFDECRRLGLTPEWEHAIRTSFPKETGALVAEIVLPEGPSDGSIEEGDVLVKVNGELLTQFVVLDDIMDKSVGNKVKLLLQRGGEDVEVEIEVGDLHKITPDRFVSVAGSSFMNLSYQSARLYAIPVKGVYVCEGTGPFKLDSSETSGCMIISIDHKKTPDLDTFIEVMKSIPDRARVVITYKVLHDLHTLATIIVHVDRHWSKKMRMAIRNDETGLWDFQDISDPLPALPPSTKKGSFITLENAPHPAAANIVRSFVRIVCQMPVKLDGFPRNRKFGVGTVIDAEKGLVVVSRAIVPSDLCDISITIADSIIVEGKVVFLHPLQNYAIVQYDPSLVDAPVLSATLSESVIQQGASACFVGFNENMRINFAQTTITDITACTIPANPSAPRYRALNVDAITCDTNLSSQCGSGVLIDQEGKVAALWLTYLGERSASTGRDRDYYLGLGTPSLLPVMRQLQAGIQPKLRMLSVEFSAIQMSQARIMGISEEWITKVALDNTARHQLFMVHKRTFERGGKSGALMEGDVVLTLNGKIITRVSELDVMYDHEELDAVIVRDCEEMHVKVKTVSADDLETDRVVSFCGAILHRPHLAVRQQISKLHSEVYVSGRARGSPASHYHLAPTNFITHVNGEKTTDLESFVQAVIKIPDNTYFRLKAVTFDDVPWVITMKKNDHYFPTSELIKDPKEPSGWRRITYEQGEAVHGEGHDGINMLPGNAQEPDDDVLCDDG